MTQDTRATNTQISPRRPFRFWSIAGALVIALCGIYFTIRCMVGYADYFGSFHDDGIYTVCAKSLASGQGYKILSLPMEPIETKYPPLFPMILSLIFLINPNFPSNIGLLESVPSLFGIGLILLSTAFLIRSKRTTLLLGMTIAAFTWSNIYYISFIPAPMADIPCIFFCVLALLLCERTAQTVKSRKLPFLPTQFWCWLAVSMMLIAATMTHVIGFFAIIASLLYLFSLRLIAGTTMVALCCLTVLLPSWYWAGTHAATSPSVLVYYTNYLQAAVSTGQHVGGPFIFVAHNIKSAFIEMMNFVLPFIKPLIPQSKAQEILIPILYTFSWISLALGVSKELMQGGSRKILAIWITVHGLSNLLWPTGVGMRRLLAVLPFVYYYIFSGTRLISAWIRILLIKYARNFNPIIFARLTALSVVSFILAAIVANFRIDMRLAGHYAFRIPPPLTAGIHYSESAEFIESYQWIIKNTTPNDILVWNNDPAAYLWTGHKAILSCLGNAWGALVNPKSYISSEDLLQSINLVKGTYLIIDPISVGDLQAFNQLGLAIENIMKQRPGLLKPVYTTRWGLITIFKINQALLH